MDFTFMIGKYDEKRLTQQLAQALDGGILIAEDGAEVELYGNGGRS